MADLIHLPFEPGLSDSTDPALAEARLRTAENIRFRQFGRAAKRYGVASGAPNALATGTAVVNALAEFGGHKLNASDCALYRLDGIGGESISLDRLSRLTPLKSVQIMASERGSSVSASDCTTANNLNVFAWHDGNATLGFYTFFALQLLDGTAVQQSRIRTGRNPRLITVGDTVWIVFEDQSTATLYYANVNSLTYSFTLPVSRALFTTPLIWDVAPWNSTQYIQVYQSALNELTIEKRTGTTTDSSTTLAIGDVPESVFITGDSSQNIILIGWRDAADNSRFAAYDGSLSLLSGGAVTLSTGGDGAVALCLTDSGAQIWAIWTTTDGLTAPTYTLRWQQVTSAGATVGTQKLVHHFRLFSRPFVIRNIPFVWTTTNGTTGQLALADSGFALQRYYFALELNKISSERMPKVHLHSAPKLAGSDPFSYNWLRNVAQTRDGDRLFAAQHVVRLANPHSTADMRVLDALYFRDWQTSVSDAYRAHMSAGNALHFAGGVVREYSRTLHETGFFWYPVITSMTPIATAGLAAGTYQYRFVYEQFDQGGRRARSAPSDIISVTSASGTTRPQFSYTSYGVGRGVLGVATGTELMSPVVGQVYRTKAGGNTFYRLTTNAQSSRAWDADVTTALITFTDDIADTSLDQQETLYVQGNVAGNYLPPSANFLAEGGGRVWLGGGWNKRRITASKIMVDGEPAQFAGDNAAFFVDYPEDITGIVWGDGSLIAWSEENVYVIPADSSQGPNDQGVGSFQVPRRMPSDTGCVTDRSIVETQDGWLFQGRRGIYLLPRGFGPPIFVGADIQSTMASYPTVRDAVRVTQPGSSDLGESTVRYLLADASGNTRVVVFDTAIKKWISVDDYQRSVQRLGVWDNKLVLADGIAAVTEDTATFKNIATGGGATYITSRLRTGELRPFGMLGWGRVNKIQIMGEIQGPATLNMKVTRDGRSVGSLTAVGKTGAAGTRFFHQHTLDTTQLNSIDVEVWDSVATGTSEGLVFHGITLETEALPNLPRLGEQERS